MAGTEELNKDICFVNYLSEVFHIYQEPKNHSFNTFLAKRWFEEPCRWSYDRDAMKDIRLMSGIQLLQVKVKIHQPLCIELMKSGSIDICNFDASWSGGPTAWKQASGAAEALGLDMAHHEEPHISAHLLGSTTTGTFLEVFHPDRDPLFYEIIENRNEFKNGFYKIPDGPGFGITLNLSVVEKYRLDR